MDKRSRDNCILSNVNSKHADYPHYLYSLSLVCLLYSTTIPTSLLNFKLLLLSCLSSNSDNINFLISDDNLISLLTRSLELNHRKIMYGNINITLAWGIYEDSSNICMISKLQSYPKCEPNNIDVNVTTADTMYTIPSERLYTSDGLADFTLSSVSDPLGTECPNLSADTVRFNSKNKP